ncbi:MAG: hypothetical protein AB2L24_20880 [Mangrovibacterium sp.]
MAPEGKKSAKIEGDYKVTQDQVYNKNVSKPIEVCVTMQNRIKGTRYGGFSWAYNESLGWAS